MYQGAKRVIEYHKQSVAKALIDLFPDIGLEKLHLHTNNCIVNKILILIKLLMLFCSVD